MPDCSLRLSQMVVLRPEDVEEVDRVQLNPIPLQRQVFCMVYYSQVEQEQPAECFDQKPMASPNTRRQHHYELMACLYNQDAEWSEWECESVHSCLLDPVVKLNQP